MADNKSDFLIGLLVGGALGAALALLYAPQSGDETRDTLKKKSEELSDMAGETYDRVKEQTSTLAAQVKDSTTSLASSVMDSTTHLASSVMDSASQVATKVNETVEKVKQDVSEGVAQVRPTDKLPSNDNLTKGTMSADTLTEAARAETARLQESVNGVTEVVVVVTPDPSAPEPEESAPNAGLLKEPTV